MGYVSCFLIGYLVATFLSAIKRDAAYEDLCKTQQKRGDHWFSRYLQACTELERCGRYLPNEDPENFYND